MALIISINFRVFPLRQTPLCLRHYLSIHRKPISHIHHPTMSQTIKVAGPATTNEELFDILSSDGSPLGVKKPRSLVHRDGDWHLSTHVWILRSDGSLLLQKRAPDKDTFPNMWDISAAGHVTAGGDSKNTAIRELEEELGLSLTDGELRLELLFRARSQNSGETTKYGKFCDNEFQDVYVVKGTDVNVEELTLQDEEVTEVKYLHYEEYQRSLEANDPHYVPRPLEYQKQFFQWLGQWQTSKFKRVI